MSFNYDYDKAASSLSSNAQETRGRNKTYLDCPQDPYPLTGRIMSHQEIRYHLYRHRGDILLHFMSFSVEDTTYTNPSTSAIKVTRLAVEAFIEANPSWAYYCFRKTGILHFIVLETAEHTPKVPLQLAAPPAGKPTLTDLNTDDITKLKAYMAYTKFRNDKDITIEEIDALYRHPDTMTTEVARSVHMNKMSGPNEQITSDQIEEPWPQGILKLRGRVDLGGYIPSHDENFKYIQLQKPNTKEDKEDWSDGYGTEDLTD